MNRKLKVEAVCVFLYAAILIRMDKTDGLRTAAQVCRWYGNRCRDLGNWAWTQAVYADNAYKELITP